MGLSWAIVGPWKASVEPLLAGIFNIPGWNLLISGFDSANLRGPVVHSGPKMGPNNGSKMGAL